MKNGGLAGSPAGLMSKARQIIDNRLAATIDIGTNSVRLLVADLAEMPPRGIARQTEITRLGEGLDRTGLISAAAAERTAAVVARFAQEAHAHGAMAALHGTAALREAKNGPEVARLIEDRAGRPLRIISGDEEALITCRGVLLGHSPGNDMIIDIGGGSTEFITLKRVIPRPELADLIARSLPLGSVRHTERHLKSAKPIAEQMAALADDVRRIVIEGVAGRRVDRLIGVAGSITQIVALELQLDPYDPGRVDGYALPLERVAYWIERLAPMPIEERRRLPGMLPARAETVPAGAVILRETLRILDLDRVIASEYDSLWGALDFS